MKKHVLFLGVILVILVLVGVSGCSRKYINPPQYFQESDLSGTWQTNYEEGRVDTITIEANGTYQQKYIDKKLDYSFETGWNSWWIEDKPDGSVYIHFTGGRYFLAGKRIAELDGKGDPCPNELPDCISGNSPRIFHDPYSDTDVEMVDELVLSVREDSREKLVLHHMWTSSDRGFAIYGGEIEVFHRVNNP